VPEAAPSAYADRVTEPIPWLDDKEMRAWRGFIVGSELLEYRLHRELQDAHGVSLADYEILVVLSEQPDFRMRMTQLAAQVASSKSRVSHQVARLERADLVKREECPNDGRGVFAVLTNHGYDTLRTAAPTHLRGVREHFVDLLSEQERATLATIFERVAARLR
jgi:DNA-binding MarR family transcriptional regulator